MTHPTPRKPRHLGDWFALATVTAGFSGLIRPAPGTWGSLVAAGLALIPALLGVGWWWLFALGALVASIANVLLGQWIEDHFRCKDPGAVVVDEVAGQWVTFIGFATLSPWHVLVGFALFRVFDIVKLPPCRRLERLPRGWGILLDDIVAGIYANVILQVLAYTWLGGSHIAGGVPLP